MDVDRRRRGVRVQRPGIEGLEERQLLATALPDLAMVSATTVDSEGVTVVYDVQHERVDRPTTFRVVRSASTAADATAVAVGGATLDPGATLDAAGQPALAVGRHTLTIPLPDGLPINPKHPNVVVVANADGAVSESNVANNTASFHKRTIGVITHGGVQPEKWAAGPPWERRMAEGLLAQGYDAVIPYNWVLASNHPGAAVRQAPRLASMVVETAQQFPAGDPVDVHFIGHSEGAVVNSQALLRMNASGATEALRGGTLKMTMLDPHPATNALPGQQYSVSSGILGFIARQEINKFQAKAKDPQVVVPPNVASAEVFYQHTPVSETNGSNRGIYNLWGQVPVEGRADYYDLTAPGISHSGKFGVQDWYRLNVVPTLGDGAKVIDSAALGGARIDAGSGARTRLTYAGLAAPSAHVRLLAGPGNTGELAPIGHSVAGPDGAWRITTRPLAQGRHRIVAASNVPPRLTGRITPLKPTAWLGSVNI